MLKKILVCLYICVLLASCDKTPPEPVVMTGSALGTTYSIKLFDLPANQTEDQLHLKLRNVIDEVDKVMSIHREDSEVTLFNSQSTSDWIRVSPELFTVIEEAQRISRLSDGAFDITLTKLIELWGFGASMGENKVPAQSDIDEALLNSGYQLLKLSRKDLSIKKTVPGLALNLSAIAKGYAVDAVGEAMEAAGIQAYLAEIGGEIRAKGKKTSGQAWRIAVEKPEAYQRSLYGIVALENQSMATSGDYRRFIEIEGKRYAHTISSKTGYPVDNDIASVSVIHPSCMTADALATAFVSMGFEKGRQLAETHQLAVLWILRSEDGLLGKKSTAFDTFWIQE